MKKITPLIAILATIVLATVILENRAGAGEETPRGDTPVRTNAKPDQAAPGQTAASGQRHLFAPAPLFRLVNGAMRDSGQRLAEKTYTVRHAKNGVDGYDWLYIVDPRGKTEGYVYEHLTSAVPDLRVPASGLLPVGQERVDRWNALPFNYRPADLVTLEWTWCRLRQVEMRREAAAAFRRLSADARRAGVPLFAFSGYRSYDTQRQLYLNRITIGERHRQMYVARPGHTEHQLGTVVDVVGTDTTRAAMLSFDNTPEARWLREHCYDYGFVLSYGADNTQATGYGAESWHIRYVGPSNVRAWVRSHLAPSHPVRKRFN